MPSPSISERLHRTLSRLLFQAPEASYEQNRAILTIQTKRRDLIPAFFFNIGAEDTILFSHANAEDLGLVVRHTKQLARELGCNIFCYDYTGYGLSVWREKRQDLQTQEEVSPWIFRLPRCHLGSENRTLLHESHSSVWE